jgi:hypothetical protein
LAGAHDADLGGPELDYVAALHLDGET